jgi:vacuolar-type H+-ATPase catalytic subunit A/Vma1
MTPLEEFPCENNIQKIIREQYWIDQLKPEMNCKASYREGTEIEKAKAYYEANAESLKEQKKVYYEANTDKIKEKMKVYREENTESIKEKKKVFREENSDKIKEQRSIKFTCECGVVICFDHKARHERSQKHQTFSIP